MTGFRDEQQPQGDSQGRESADSARGADERSASPQDREEKTARAGFRRDGEADTAGRVVTTVNPRIVPAGSRSPVPPPPPPGRPWAVLAVVAALSLAGLSAGGYLLFGGDEARETTGSGVTPGPEWNGGQDNEAPGSASPPSDSPSGKDKGKDKDKKPGPAPSSHDEPSGDGGESDGGDRPPQNGDGQAPPAPERPPRYSDGSVRIWNHNSDQCINVPGGEGRDGTALAISTCADVDSMRWTFENDGTVRALGLCMDVAGGSRENGTVIQLAYCSGNPAQQFVLSEGSDLVNPQANKCVMVKDGNIQSGTPLVLWDCSGEDSQKWSRVW
jgi:hypothetical protein